MFNLQRHHLLDKLLKIKYNIRYMGNKKGLIWYCVLFYDTEKTEIIKTLKCNTIKELSYYLGLEPQTIRNYYHKNIKARGVLQYCNITQNLKI
tara:strand:- start:404 stop:682 length:279 start_codon:yes stop_codon:yes gene_type:complete